MNSAIYIRVSTEDQVKDGYSLEIQREYLESFAGREGYEILGRETQNYPGGRAALDLRKVVHPRGSCRSPG